MLSFLGLANFYRRFVRRFAHVAAPLHKLTGKGVTAGGGAALAEFMTPTEAKPL